MKTESCFLKHIACGRCGSSDANALYDDGHTYCHGCHTLANEDETESHERGYEEMKRQQSMKAPMEIKGTIKSIPERGINKSTCEKYGVTQDNDNHYYPYTDSAGSIVIHSSASTASETLEPACACSLLPLSLPNFPFPSLPLPLPPLKGDW